MLKHDMKGTLWNTQCHTYIYFGGRGLPFYEVLNVNLNAGFYRTAICSTILSRQTYYPLAGLFEHEPSHPPSESFG